jgi:hypothetical protein
MLRHEVQITPSEVTVLFRVNTWPAENAVNPLVTGCDQVTEKPVTDTVIPPLA